MSAGWSSYTRFDSHYLACLRHLTIYLVRKAVQQTKVEEMCQVEKKRGGRVTGRERSAGKSKNRRRKKWWRRKR